MRNQRSVRGVSLVAVHKRERIESGTSGSTSCQFLKGRFLDLRLIVIALHTTPLYLSAWPFPSGR